MPLDHARDPDDLHGDAVVFALEIKVRRNGAMSVAGSIFEEAYALAALDAAKQSIKDHNARRRLDQGGSVIVPPHDTPWERLFR